MAFVLPLNPGADGGILAAGLLFVDVFPQSQQVNPVSCLSGGFQSRMQRYDKTTDTGSA